MASLMYDLRYALRQIRNARVFSFTVMLVLALGIGANTAVFTLVHAVLLKSLPVAKPEQLFRIGDREMCCVNGGLEGSWSLFPYDAYKYFRDNSPVFEQLAAFQAGRGNVGLRRINSGTPAESVSSEFVSGNYFQMFGIGAYAGRVFTANDDQPGKPPLAVLSYRVWQEKYGSDASIIGSAVAVNGAPFTITGVAPPGFFGDGLRSNPPEVWIPLSFEPQVHGANSLLNHDEASWLNAIGRVRAGEQTTQVEAQLTTELRQWLSRPGNTLGEEQRREIPQQVIRLTPGGSGVQIMREQYEQGLRILLWVTGFVLLIACANLANLMLARTAGRRQEISIRTALGASRTKLIQQIVSETLLLALFGGAGGIFLAMSGARIILRLAFPHQYVPIDTSPSWPVLGFAFAVSLASGLLFGIVPAWLMSRAQPMDALRASNRATDQRSHWVQRSLVIVQTSLSLVLLCAAGLVLQSLYNLRHQHFGFETAGRYLVEFDPQMAGYKTEQLDGLYRQIRDGMQQIPGVESVSYAQYTPMSGSNWEGRVRIEGRESEDDSAVFVRVGPGYFSAIGTRVLRGRAIAEQDTATTRPVAVVNQEFVKRYLDGKDPIGAHLGALGSDNTNELEIVGVTENTNYWFPGEKFRPMYFVAASQQIKRADPESAVDEQRTMYMNNIILRFVTSIPNLEEHVRRVIAEINPDLPVIKVVPFAEQVHGKLDQQQMIAQLMTIFGLLALTLATVGLYGVTSYGVERRANEIGIRMALGAGRLGVVRMVMRSVVLECVTGLVIGVLLVSAAGRLLASKLFGVSAFDVTVLSSAIVGLVLSALVAGYLPARRAAGIDPMQALRSE